MINGNTDKLMLLSIKGKFKFKTSRLSESNKSLKKQSKFSFFNELGQTLSRKKYCGYFQRIVETVHNIL